MNLDKNSKIICCGPGGTGKDFLRKKLEYKGWKYGVLYTTRSARSNEKFGVDYFFINDQQFEDLKQTDQLVESSYFAEKWHYGTSLDVWNNSNLFIMSPNSLKQIKEKITLNNCFVIYLNVDKEIRRHRLISRQDADSVERRLKTDEEDFKDFKDFDIQIQDPNF